MSYQSVTVLMVDFQQDQIEKNKGAMANSQVFSRQSSHTETSCYKIGHRDLLTEPKSVLDLTTISPASSPENSPNRMINMGSGGPSLHKSILQKSYSMQYPADRFVGDIPSILPDSPHSPTYVFSNFTGYTSDSNDAMSTNHGNSSDNDVIDAGMEVLGDLDPELDLDFVMKTQTGLADVFGNSPRVATDHNLWYDSVLNVLDPDGFMEVGGSLSSVDDMVHDEILCAASDIDALHGFGDGGLSLKDSLESPIERMSSLHFDKKRPYVMFEDDHLLSSLSNKGEAAFPHPLPSPTCKQPLSSFSKSTPIPYMQSANKCLFGQPSPEHIESQLHIGNISYASRSSLQPCSPSLGIPRPGSITDIPPIEEPIHSSSVIGIPTCIATIEQEPKAFQHNPQEEQGLQLVHLLLFCAEMVGERQYDVVQPLLSKLQAMSSPDGAPMERIAYYFSETLLKRVHAPASTKYFSLIQEEDCNDPLDFVAQQRRQAELDKSYLALYQAMPYTKCLHFTANQALLEAMADSSHLHVLDFDIQQGIQWPNFLQSLAVRPGGPPKSIKLSAIGACIGRLNQTARMLGDFAGTLNLNFTFQPVVVKNIKDLQVSMFRAAGEQEVDEDEEAVAVNFPAILDSGIWEGVTAELFLGFVRRLRPRVLTIMKAERHNDSPTFVHRFIEVLCYYSALFDSLELSLDRKSPDRAGIERILLGSGLRNIVSSSPLEPLEDLAMHASMEKWQYLLDIAGFQTTQLSQHALYQAKLLLRLYASEAFKLGDHSGGASALTIGWKDTPLFAVMASAYNNNNNNKRKEHCRMR